MTKQYDLKNLNTRKTTKVVRITLLFVCVCISSKNARSVPQPTR